MIKKGEKTEVVRIRMLTKDMDKVRGWQRDRTKRGLIHKPVSVLLRERLHYDINRKHIKHRD
jgi:predicted component of type VI protein secretion system